MCQQQNIHSTIPTHTIIPPLPLPSYASSLRTPPLPFVPSTNSHLQNRVQVHIGTRSVHWSDISRCPSWEEDTSNKRRGGKTIWKGDGGEHAGSTHSRVWPRHDSLPYSLPTLLLRSLLPPTLRQRINSPSHLVLS